MRSQCNSYRCYKLLRLLRCECYRQNRSCRRLVSNEGRTAPRERVVRTDSEKIQMKVWDDNEFPLAYLITFRTYGTWLHGDERGSIDRYHNRYKGERVPANAVIQQQHKVKLKSKPVLLDASNEQSWKP